MPPVHSGQLPVDFGQKSCEVEPTATDGLGRFEVSAGPVARLPLACKKVRRRVRFVSSWAIALLHFK